MSEQDVAKMKHVNGAEISPDGNHIAYTMVVQRDLAEDDNGSSYANLHVVDTNGDSKAFVTGKSKCLSNSVDARWKGHLVSRKTR